MLTLPVASVYGGKLVTMTLTLSEEEVPLVIRALEHYYSLTVAEQTPDERYRELVERLKPRKSKAGVSTAKKRKRA